MSDKEDGHATGVGLKAEQRAEEPVVEDDVNGQGAPSDEEEGDDVFDSSEEDDDLDNDEEEAQKVREGFIVDDDDEDEDEDGDGVESGVKKKRRKRRAREEENDALDEDDLDLLMENAGYKRPSESEASKQRGKLKRLKRVGEEGEESGSVEPESGHASSNKLDDFFSEDDEEDEGMEDDVSRRASSRKKVDKEVTLADDMDDFIEEDEFSDEDEEARKQRIAEKKRMKEQRLVQPAQITGLSPDKVDEMFEVFGDGHDYDWALELENEEELDRVDESSKNEQGDDDEFATEAKKKKKLTLQDIYDLQDLKKNLLTEEDMQIRKADIPERYQELRTGLKNYGKLSPEDIELEKNWISDKVAVDKNFDADYDTTEFKDAIGNAINFIQQENLEVSFIYAYRRNYISSRNKDGFVLIEDDLWDIVFYDIEFHSIIYKRDYVKTFYQKLELKDPIVDEYFNNQTMTELNSLQDIYDYVEFKYAQDINDVLLSAQQDAASKKHLKNSSYEKFKTSALYQAVNDIGITAEQVGENISAEHQLHPVVDHPSLKPSDSVAQILEGPEAKDLQIFSQNPKLALETIEKYYALELSKNPKVRQKIRDDFYKYYIVDVALTSKGRQEIQRGSPYEDIKYAIGRTPAHFRSEPDVFLRMLEAESLHLLNIQIHVSSQDQYTNHLFQTSLETSNTSEIAVEWNAFRRRAFDSALNKVFSDVSQEIKDELKKTCQRLVTKSVRHQFMFKLDQAPFIPNPKDPKIPRVLTITCGQGKFGSDAIIAVYLNRKTEYVRDYKIVENPFDRKEPELFENALDEIIQHCQPNVIGINGPNPSTQRLYKKIQEVVQKKQIVDNRGFNVPVIYVEDEIAVRYQSSQRAAQEFPSKPTLVKYCIALGRYIHSPLLEYANLSEEELLSLSIHNHQSLLPRDLFLQALETSFVDIVNLVGIEVNKATDNPYYAKALRYIAGFGKRKAADFLESLQRLNEPLLARQQLITHDILTKTIFMNSAAFLYISWNEKTQRYEDLEHDQLDGTRIHPEDYHLATKVAADALEFDPDAIAEKEEQGTMSEFIELLREDPDRRSKLESLNLESYAEELEKNTGQRKLNNLNTIVLELLDGFEELRNDFHPLHGDEVFKSLTGESEKTFFKGCIIPIRVERFRHNDIYGVTNSGVECIVNAQRHLGAQLKRPAEEVYEIGKTYPAKVIYIDYENISCEVSLLEHDIRRQYVPIHYSKDPSIWNVEQEAKDQEVEKRLALEEARAKRTHRVINHPYYGNFTGPQAEDYLRSRERGDFVIRQSSRGDDHLAITWKLDKDLFQHVDILEKDKENPLALGKTLIVEDQKYHDLDQIIVEYLQNKVRLLNEITSNEKFKKGTKKEVIKFIEDYSKVNPNRSVYYFSFNYEHPGWFYLMFKINAQSQLYVWNVKLTHTGFFLVNYNYPTVIQLCNGFKTLLKSSSRAKTQDNNTGGYYGY